MKILVLVSSLDLSQPFSATPAWWQLLKGLYEIGVEVIAAPYQGPAIDSLWWRAEANPARWQGGAFKSARDILRALRPKTGRDLAAAPAAESLSDIVVRATAQKLIAPLWRDQLARIMRREGDICAILFITVPLNHLRGVPRSLSQTFDVPVFFYDGDVPASLPSMQGFASGFRIYPGADLSEYTAFISNSSGGEELLRQLGARQAHTLWYGADPAVFRPVPVPTQDIDLLFYGHGREYREEWIDSMIRAPASQLRDYRFAVRGTKLGDMNSVQALPYLSFSKLREYICRSKLNLCITRGAHANLYASSSSRPFELGALGACIVANPYAGIEEWLEPDKEVIIVNSADEALERYQFLLRNDRARQQIGAAARERVLKQHSFRHRAQELVDIIRQYT